MALTRKALKAMGLTDEQVDSIIEMHSETVDGLKADLNKYKTDAEKLPNVEKELEKAQADLEAGKKDSWKVKYEAVKEEFDSYKTEQTAKETKSAKEKAYTALLKEAGVNDKRIAAVLKVSNLDDIELEGEEIKDKANHLSNIKSEWADFIGVTETKGTPISNPVINTCGAKMTKEEIYKKDEHGRYVLSTAERQKALAENLK